MQLIRYQNRPVYNPLTSYTSLRDELDRLFDDAVPTLSRFQRDGIFGDWPGEFPVDVYQEKEAFMVRAELPGFRKEDIEVELADGALTITRHQKSETTPNQKEKVSSATTRERRVSRSISLPEELKLDKIEAVYENGVLTVTLPKSEEAKPKQIAIQVK